MFDFFVDIATADNLATCRVDQLLHSVHVEISDHLSLEFASFGLLPIHLLEFDLDRLDEFFDARLVHEDVVWSDADLARVNCLAKCDLTGREIHRCCMVHDKWALSAKFENAWSQVLGSRLGNNLADLGRAGEADQVKVEVVESHGDINGTFDADDSLTIAILFDEFLHAGAGGRGKL